MHVVNSNAPLSALGRRVRALPGDDYPAVRRFDDQGLMPGGVPGGLDDPHAICDDLVAMHYSACVVGDHRPLWHRVTDLLRRLDLSGLDVDRNAAAVERFILAAVIEVQ